ncbi:hypothetical protein C8R46DRAFT_1329413 [Mycena filopes]|nr:hypothetical protein C8R46DRAFT_1329413 [Mycena filopes]
MFILPAHAAPFHLTAAAPAAATWWAPLRLPLALIASLVLLALVRAVLVASFRRFSSALPVAVLEKGVPVKDTKSSSWLPAYFSASTSTPSPSPPPPAPASDAPARPTPAPSTAALAPPASRGRPAARAGPVRRPEPTLSAHHLSVEAPLPALYACETPVSMAKMIMSRHSAFCPLRRRLIAGGPTLQSPSRLVTCDEHGVSRASFSLASGRRAAAASLRLIVRPMCASRGSSASSSARYQRRRLFYWGLLMWSAASYRRGLVRVQAHLLWGVWAPVGPRRLIAIGLALQPRPLSCFRLREKLRVSFCLGCVALRCDEDRAGSAAHAACYSTLSCATRRLCRPHPSFPPPPSPVLLRLRATASPTPRWTAPPSRLPYVAVPVPVAVARRRRTAPLPHGHGVCPAPHRPTPHGTIHQINIFLV